jgi:hypothetical protein
MTHRGELCESFGNWKFLSFTKLLSLARHIVNDSMFRRCNTVKNPCRCMLPLALYRSLRWCPRLAQGKAPYHL